MYVQQQEYTLDPWKKISTYRNRKTTVNHWTGSIFPCKIQFFCGNVSICMRLDSEAQTELRSKWKFEEWSNPDAGLVVALLAYCMFLELSVFMLFPEYYLASLYASLWVVSLPT